MADDVTLEYVLDVMFPPISKRGYLALLPLELRTELAKFKSSSTYNIYSGKFDDDPLTYRIIIHDNNFRCQIFIQPQRVKFSQNDDTYLGQDAVLQFFLYNEELNDIPLGEWSTPVDVLITTETGYDTILSTTNKNYEVVSALTPGPDLSLEIGPYCRFSISRDLIVMMYDLAK